MNSNNISLSTEIIFNNYHNFQLTSTFKPAIHLKLLTEIMFNNTTALINCTGKKAITDWLVTKIIFFLSYLTIFATSIFGNSLVVYVVFTTKNMQTVTNIFITNLAISDLLVCCTSLWLTPVYTYVGHWIWGGWLCYGLPLFQGTSIFISTLTLMSIAVDRYCVICHHSKSIVNINERMSMQVCIAIIALIWMVSLLLVMPYAVHMRMAYVQKPCDFWLCIEDWAIKDLKSIYGIIVLSLQFIVPFAIIGHSYIRIWKFLNYRKRKSRRSLMISDRESEYETQRKKRLLRMLVTMVVLFVICWLPFNLLNILRDMKKDAFLKPYFSFFFLLAHLISMTTTPCNPILYAWMNHGFRNEFIRVVPCLNTIRIFSRKRTNGANIRKKFLPRDSLALNARSKTQIITDCEPALNRWNCNDSVFIKPKIFKKKLEQKTLSQLTNRSSFDNKQSINNLLETSQNKKSEKCIENALILSKSNILMCNKNQENNSFCNYNLQNRCSNQKNLNLPLNILPESNKKLNNYDISKSVNGAKSTQLKKTNTNAIEKLKIDNFKKSSSLELEKKHSNEFAVIKLWKLTRNFLKLINVK